MLNSWSTITGDALKQKNNNFTYSNQKTRKLNFNYIRCTISIMCNREKMSGYKTLLTNSFHFKVFPISFFRKYLSLYPCLYLNRVHFLPGPASGPPGASEVPGEWGGEQIVYPSDLFYLICFQVCNLINLCKYVYAQNYLCIMISLDISFTHSFSFMQLAWKLFSIFYFKLLCFLFYERRSHAAYELYKFRFFIYCLSNGFKKSNVKLY